MAAAAVAVDGIALRMRGNCEEPRPTLLPLRYKVSLYVKCKRYLYFVDLGARGAASLTAAEAAVSSEQQRHRQRKATPAPPEVQQQQLQQLCYNDTAVYVVVPVQTPTKGGRRINSCRYDRVYVRVIVSTRHTLHGAARARPAFLPSFSPNAPQYHTDDAFSSSM